MKRNDIETKSSFHRFTFKGSVFLLTMILLSTLGFPLLLNSMGLELRFLRVIVIGLVTGFATAYSLYFIDSKRGLTRGFWTVAILVALLAGFLSYFWIFDIYYL